MKLRIWIPCILLLVILIVFLRSSFTEGFQASPPYTPPPSQGIDQTRINFWSILAQDKAGSSSGGSSGGSSGSINTNALLSQVMSPGPKDTFTMVYPKYLSMYSLAKYGFDPVVARNALINQYSALQTELQTTVETEQVMRTRFSGDPQGESCAQLNTLTMAFYGKLVSVYSAAQDLSGAAYSIGSFHDENMNLQNSVLSACTNQGGTPSADCIKLATMDEKLFPLLPAFDAINTKLLTNGQDIQDTIDTLVQAYIGMGCNPPTGGSENTLALSINTVFSGKYLDSLATIDMDTLNTKLQELSPYYVSPNIINYISRKLIGTSEFNAGLSDSLDYLRDMNKTTNSIVSLNMTSSGAAGSGKYFSETTGGFANCPGGYYCPPASAPVKCPVGTYCPPGTLDEPIQCPLGTFSPAGSDDESKCTTALPLGYYQDQTDGKMVECPTGSYCANGEITTCPAGTYNMKKGMSDSKSCLDCPKGAYCPSPTSIKPCDAGTYNPSTRQTESSACAPCPAGTSCVNKGTVTPTPCAAGTFSSVPALAAACTPVAQGYYLAGTANTSDSGKQACPAGYYCAGGTRNPTICPPGTFCDTEKLSAPKPCAAGYYGSTAGLTGSTGTTGTTGTSGTRGSTPSMCSGRCMEGYICPPGSSVNNALPCPEGYYCGAGSAAGILCPAGSYCPYISSSPTPCPSGTHNIGTGKISVTDCKPCPPGKVCNIGTADEGQPCPVGYYCPGGSVVNPCIQGTYCDVTGLSEPTLCPAGTFNPNTGSSKITDCVPCTAGTWSDSVGEIGSCSQTCPTGSYCPSPNGMLSYTIPPSSLSLYSGNPAIVPTNGKITIPTGTTAPVSCPAGTYCDTAGTVVPKRCPSGTYSGLTGQTQAAACIPCEPGTYCPTAGGGSYTVCPPGTYCPTQGGSSPTQCPIANICPIPRLQAANPCPPGQLCDTVGEITPRAPCPPGTYSTGGAGSSCTPCPSGYYGAGQSTTSQCSGVCPAGYYCPAGTTPLGASGNTPVPCPLGYYCPAGTGTCAAGKYLFDGECVNSCPAGTYSKGGEPFCSTCAAPAGQYCSGGTTQFTACPSGYTCDGGTSIPYRYYCPLGGTVTGAQCKIGVGPFSCSQYIPMPYLYVASTYWVDTKTLGVFPDSEGGVCYNKISGVSYATATTPSSYRYTSVLIENLY